MEFFCREIFLSTSAIHRAEHGRRAQQSGHWLAQHLFEHYAFGKDRHYLEDVYPIMKGAAEFFVEFLAPWSPENDYLSRQHGKLNKQCYGAAWDQQLILNLFTDCIEASYILKRDEPFRKTLQEMIPRLSPQKIGQYGQLQEWPDDRDDPSNTHRHISQLIALHPGRDISSLTTQELTDAALVTMQHRGDLSTGWSTGWKTCFWARLHDGDKARQLCNFLTAKRAYPNLFDFHPPFQIDGNLGGAAGVCEMLLQSHLRSVNPEATTIEEAAFVAYQQDAENASHFVPVCLIKVSLVHLTFRTWCRHFPPLGQKEPFTACVPSAALKSISSGITAASTSHDPRNSRRRVPCLLKWQAQRNHGSEKRGIEGLAVVLSGSPVRPDSGVDFRISDSDLLTDVTTWFDHANGSFDRSQGV